MTRRSTRTITVLCALSLTTIPLRMRLGIAENLLRRRTRFLIEEGQHAGDVAPHLPRPDGVLQLAARFLEAQVELLLLQARQVALQLVRRLVPQIFGLHGQPSSPSRATKRVRIGSFAAASSNARLARSRGTPSTSNMMRPGCTRQAQNSGAPLPLPMRTSA